MNQVLDEPGSLIEIPATSEARPPSATVSGLILRLIFAHGG
jgi:hypothetical protein